MIYDAHSHIGLDSFHPIAGSLAEFIERCLAFDITRANLMTVPSPEYWQGDTKINSVHWDFSSGKREYNRLETRNGEVTKIPYPSNPYAESNKMLREQIRKERSAVTLDFVPLLHPILDTDGHIEEVLANDPVAVKIHGIACGISPEEVPANVYGAIAESQTPVVVHTDYWNSEIVSSPIQELNRINAPLRWLEQFEKYGIRSFITHGARLCSDSLSLINNSDNYLVGIAPDVLIESEPERLAQDKSYLACLKESLHPSKLAFDIDYPWNTTECHATSLEWGFLDRAIKIYADEQLTRDLLYRNASQFFDRI